MSEFLQKAQTALEHTVQMTRYRALETMEAAEYNPVTELIDIANQLKRQDLRDYSLEIRVHMKLLEYYSPAPKKQLDLNVQGGSPSVVVMPISYASQYHALDLAPCKPKLVDALPAQTELEALMGDANPPD
jgi:hypothetical protein